MEWLLAVAALGLAYPYVLYPMLLAGLGRKSTAPSKSSGDLPSVAILVSAFNEEARIGDKVANFRALDYPGNRIEMWIGTDGSEDRTAEVVRKLNDPRIHLVERFERAGKTAVLNDLASRVRSEVLVFTDVTAAFRPDAVRRLAMVLQDPKTGLVSGRTVIRSGGNVQVEGAYYRLESFLKEREGACGWLAGADGAIYALRARLYRSLPTDLINDLVHPSQVVAEGFAARFEPLAVSEEPAGDDAAREFDRQTRITAQASYLLAGQWSPLVRKRRWGMLWVLLSHKWLRWIAGLWMPLAFIAFAVQGPLFAAAASLFALLLFAGWRLGASWAGLPVYFLVVHCAYLKGLWQALAGERYVTWKPRAG